MPIHRAFRGLRSSRSFRWRVVVIVAFVVPRPGGKPSEGALRRYAPDNGPADAHPRAVWFIDERPLAGINKIDRRTLAQRAGSLFVREDQRRERLR